MDGYITYRSPTNYKIGDATYTVQYFQGDHADEYTMKNKNKVCLYYNGILKMVFQENQYGCQTGDFTRFDNGHVAFVQSFDEILDNSKYFYRIVNHVRGERLEIYSSQSGKLVYHGEFNNQDREREGWGIEYDEDSGAMRLEGMWKKNNLVEIIRKIEGNSMIEFKRNGNNVLVSDRIPMYIGEFRYDESSESFIRNGVGYCIDEETRIAYREVEWKDGSEVCGKELFDGWYHPNCQLVNLGSTTELNKLNLQVTDLVISSNCCNDVDTLNLNNLTLLQSLEIGDDCFGSVKHFSIDGLNRLKRVKIGNDSFTEVKQAEWDDDYKGAVARANDSSKYFSIVNCEWLEWIEIGKSSFADFGGKFELRNLASVKRVKIGDVGSKSWNFDLNQSFVLQGS